MNIFSGVTCGRDISCFVVFFFIQLHPERRERASKVKVRWVLLVDIFFLFTVLPDFVRELYKANTNSFKDINGDC